MRHKEATRRRLYEAAISLFSERGYDATSIDDIAELADVARATVFNYFKSKEDFIAAWGDERRRQLGSLLIQESTRNSHAADQLRHCMRVLGEVNEREREMARSLLMAWVRAGGPFTEEPHSAYILAQIITDGKARGQVREEVDPIVVGNALRDIYLGSLYRWLGQDRTPPFSLTDSLETALDIVLRGVLPTSPDQ